MAEREMAMAEVRSGFLEGAVVVCIIGGGWDLHRPIGMGGPHTEGPAQIKAFRRKSACRAGNKMSAPWLVRQGEQAWVGSWEPQLLGQSSKSHFQPSQPRVSVPGFHLWPLVMPCPSLQHYPGYLCGLVTVQNMWHSFLWEALPEPQARSDHSCPWE